MIVKESVRDVLLETAVDYVMKHGLKGLSLRPLASALGTSARMLVYHFGSKEQLVDEVFSRAERRWMTTVHHTLAQHSEILPAFDAVWGLLKEPTWRDYLGTLYELWGVALSEPDRYRSFCQTMVADWSSCIDRLLERQGVGRQGRTGLVCLILSLFNGLLLQRLSGTDEAAVEEAYHLFRSLIKSQMEQPS